VNNVYKGGLLYEKLILSTFVEGACFYHLERGIIILNYVPSTTSVLLCFVLFAFSGLCLVLVMPVLDLSFVRIFQHISDVNGTVLMCR